VGQCRLRRAGFQLLVRPLKILIVSQYFSPDITAAAFRIAETADILHERGHDVRVVCAVPHKATVEGDAAVAPAYPVDRVSIAALSGGGMIGYLKHYLSFVFGACLRVLKVTRAEKPDIVWISSPPLFIGLVGIAISFLRRLPFVLDVRDIWPESAVAAGQIGAGGRAFKIGKRLEALVYKRAAAISCVSNPMAEYLRSVSGKPVAVVYNGVRRTMAEGLDAEGGDAARKRIVYAGNLGRAQGLEVLIQAFDDASASGVLDGWDLEFVGGGALEANLKEIAAATSRPAAIRFLPPMSKADVMRYMASSDLLFINLEAAPVFEKTIPSKVFDYMLVGRPILAGLKGEGASILAQTGGNVLCEPSDRRSMAEAIGRAVGNWPELAEKAKANRAVATEKYSREEAVGVLEDIFNKVAAKKAT